MRFLERLGLYNLDWGNWATDRELALKAVEKLTIQNNLTNVARTAFDWVVRKAAVEKLTDHKILAAIAESDDAPDVRKAAVRRIADLIRNITDQAVLADLEVSGDAKVREIAKAVSNCQSGHHKWYYRGRGYDIDPNTDSRHYYTLYKCEYCGAVESED